MPFWSGEKLSEELQTLISPFNRAAIDCAAYTLRVGDEVYISPDRAVAVPARHTKQILKPGEGFTIPPGQFAFLTTKEIVSVPDKAIAFISIRARLKFRGLVNISGFHVDPGYKGELIFSVLNAGPTPLHLEQGQALFLIWYADLDRQTTRKKQASEGFGGLDPQMINGISGEILSLQSLSEKQRDLERDLVRQLQEQKTLVARLGTQVQIMLGLSLTLFGGLVLLGIREWLSSGTP
jgi:dCTP deaminase